MPTLTGSKTKLTCPLRQAWQQRLRQTVSPHREIRFQPASADRSARFSRHQILCCGDVGTRRLSRSNVGTGVFEGFRLIPPCGTSGTAVAAYWHQTGFTGLRGRLIVVDDSAFSCSRIHFPKTLCLEIRGYRKWRLGEPESQLAAVYSPDKSERTNPSVTATNNKVNERH